MADPVRKVILDAEGVANVMNHLADKILSAGPADPDFVLIGIRTGGAFLARRLRTLLEAKTDRSIPTGILDINLYRDDWTRAAPKPVVGKTELNFSIDDKRVVLIDDVLFTGRTVRSALDALMDFGRPARIDLVVLVDRGYRELPICADLTGLAVETTLDERVNVYLSELGHKEEVVIERTWTDQD